MSFCRLKFESQKKAKIINESCFHLAMAQRRQRAADHLFPCRLPPPSCFSKRWCFFHNCPQCSNQDRPLLDVGPFLPINHRGYLQVMSAKLNFWGTLHGDVWNITIDCNMRERQTLSWKIYNPWIESILLLQLQNWRHILFGGFHTNVQPKTESLSMPIVAKVWITLTCPPGWSKKLSSSVAICVDAASLGLKYL